MYFLFGSGVNKLQHTGMQAQAVNGRILVAMTVLAVANDRVPDALHMNTNLIGSPRLEVKFNER